MEKASPVFRQVGRGERLSLAILFLSLLIVGAVSALLWWANEAQAAPGDLTVEIVAGYNLVVDSNVLSPSTYAPSVATVMGRVCNNTPSTTMQGVQIFIGDYNSGTPANSTPGQYPQRATDSGGAFDTAYPHLAGTPGAYYFQHVGGQVGVADATRFVGDLAAGECQNQYWHFTYPRRSNLAADNDNLGPDPIWGETNLVSDDLWLEFDIWSWDNSGPGSAFTDDATWRMTMRNEISAAANKIRPNPDGQWFNTDPTTRVGETITSNGILYELGNINQGFDNDGDFVPDYNAWMQPVGVPSFDPSCFRLIKSSGVLTVTRSMGLPDLIINFDDSYSDPIYGGPMYFTNLPVENTSVRGKVFYTFFALYGECSTAISPYQEVASGFNNEKFNGDYGTGIPPLVAEGPLVTLDKSSNPNSVTLGGTTTYRMPFANTSSTESFGLGLSAGSTTPLVISDTVPNGLQYVGSSATATLTYSNTGVTIRYSTDSGATWSTTDPGTTASTAPNSLVKVQWWLNDALPPNSSGSYAEFQATVPGGYTGTPFIENCADARVGGGTPFLEACAITMIQGNNSLGDFVWRDDDSDGQQDGGEPSINNVEVRLYYDANDDNLPDAGDTLIGTQDSAAGGCPAGTGCYLFSSLPDGIYLVEVDDADGDIPTGHRPSTPTIFAVDLDPTSADTNPVNYLNADFGFSPVLQANKRLTSTDPALEGGPVTYEIGLTNNRPGDGSGTPQTCTYTDWSDALSTPYTGTGNKAWTNPGKAVGDPDTVYATAPYNNAGEIVGVTDWNLGTYSGAPNSVEVLVDLVLTGNFGVNETLDVILWDCGADDICDIGGGSDDFEIGRQSYLAASELSTGQLTVDFTADRSWTWADFNAADIVVQLEANKSGNNTGTIDVDAMAFKVSNGLTCNDPADIISPLPLTDTYDPTKVRFVSASPAVDSAAPLGTLTWNDLGPLYPGQTLSVTVNFVALEPPNSDADPEPDPTTHQNCADSGGTLGAMLLSGGPTNDAQSCVTHGIDPAGRIGDTIWNDNAGPLNDGTASDGIQNGSEQGIGGVTVYLCSGTVNPCNLGSSIAVTTTNASGYYIFPGLTDGTYSVGVDTAALPGSTYTQTGDPDEAGLCTTCDNNSTTTIAPNDGVAGNDDDLTRDFGYLIPNTIYGNVFEDNDAGADQDAGENGIPAVDVYLCLSGVSPCNSGTAFQSTTTDGNGDYRFIDLPDGSYYIQVYTATLPAGGTWTNTVDPEGAPGDDQSNLINASGGNTYGSYDFGYYRSGTLALGDTVYADWNGDGDQNGGEEGINGITVSLYQDDNGDGVIDPGTDGLIATTVTAAGACPGGNGCYSFTGLPAQSYIIVVDESGLPGGYLQTQDPDEAGTCVTCDGQGLATIGPDDLTVDFGYQPTGSGAIGDYLWQDTNGDGSQGAAEPPISGVTVNLYEDSNNDGVIDSGDALVATDVTDANGLYLFTGLPAGDYLVDVPTTIDIGGTNYYLSTNEPLPEPNGGINGPDNDPFDVSLAAGETYLDADFGYTTGGIIGDYIWQDNDGDGSQNQFTEPGISGVTVYLCASSPCNSSTAIYTQTTDVDGLYEFTDLPPGDYLVAVNITTLPNGGTGWTQTGDPDAASPAPPCTLSVCDDESSLTLAAGQIDRSQDFGYQPPNTIGDYVWFDSNGDGVQDAGESPIPAVVLYIDDGSCEYPAAPGGPADCLTATTDGVGLYSFGNRPGITDTVRVDTATLPSGVVQTYDNSGGLDDAGVGDTTGGVNDFTIDFGYRYAGAYGISGTVFFDGVQDNSPYDGGTSDAPFEGIPVYLWDDQGSLVASTTTLPSGMYTFTNLPDGGTFTVSVDDSGPQLGLLGQSYDPTPAVTCPSASCNNSSTVTISGANVTQQDFGYYEDQDCGDLPDSSYYTLIASQGACHVHEAAPTLYLGSAIDFEANGQPNFNATGDDADGGDDDDGVTRSAANWTLGVTATLNISVTGSNGYLVGWFDWNVDGDLNDPGERIIFGAVPAGASTVDLMVPNDGSYTLGDDIFVRFRLYDGTPSTISSTGAVKNGEVEDYFWPFSPTAITLGLTNTTGLAAGLSWSLALVAIGLLVTGLYLVTWRRRVIARD